MHDDDKTPVFGDEPTVPDRASLDAVLITGTAKRFIECGEAFETIGREFDELDPAEQRGVLQRLHAEAGRLSETVHDLRRYLGARLRRAQAIEDGR